MAEQIERKREISEDVAELLWEGAHLCEYEEPSYEEVSSYRTRCRALLRRIGVKDAEA